MIAGKIGIPKNLREVKIAEGDLPLLAEKSLTASSTKVNPREVKYNSLLEFLKRVF